MRLQRLPLLAAAVLCAFAPAALRADQADPVTRLKDLLKSTTLQLRSVSAERDTLQGQVTDLQSQVDTLTKQAADLAKKSADEKATDDKTIAVLKGQVSDQEDSIAALQTSLDKWKDQDKQAVALYQATEAKRAKLADLSIHLQRRVDDQHRKNDDMYRLGMELLDRYEKFGLGEALTAKEPFVGITRTKFETLVQDYEDKLLDQKITGDNANPAASPSPAAKSKP